MGQYHSYHLSPGKDQAGRKGIGIGGFSGADSRTNRITLANAKLAHNH